MAKKLVRLTESDLQNIIKESVNSILNEKLYGMNRLQNESEEKIPAHKFLPELNKTYHNLHREYSSWQYSPAKPKGMDVAIDAIIDAMHAVKDIIDDIKWEQEGKPIYDTDDPQQY